MRSPEDDHWIAARYCTVGLAVYRGGTYRPVTATQLFRDGSIAVDLDGWPRTVLYGPEALIRIHVLEPVSA